MTRALFFLGGASLLSGLEARRRFGIAREDACVLATPRIAAALTSHEWGAHAIVTTKARGQNRLLHAIDAGSAVADFVARHGPFDDVFLADLTTAMRLTALTASPARVTVLDDGLFAPTAAAQRRVVPRTLWGRVLDPPQVRFFSAFDVVGRDGDDVVVNDYRCLRSEVDARRSDGEEWIIGQPLVENDVMTADDYADVVAAIAAGLRNPVYICHPLEKPEFTPQLARGLPTRRHALPVELELLRRPTRPARMLGFYSSALPLLTFLLGAAVPIDAHRLPLERIRRAHEPIGRAYAALAALSVSHPSLRVVGLADRAGANAK